MQYRALIKETSRNIRQGAKKMNRPELFQGIKEEFNSLKVTDSEYKRLAPLDSSLKPKEAQAAGKYRIQTMQRLAKKHGIEIPEAKTPKSKVFWNGVLYNRLMYVLTFGPIRSRSINGTIAMEMSTESDENFTKIIAALTSKVLQIQDKQAQIQAGEEILVLKNGLSQKKELAQMKFSRNPKRIHEAWERLIAPLREFAEKHEMELDPDLLTLKGPVEVTVRYNILHGERGYQKICVKR